MIGERVRSNVSLVVGMVILILLLLIYRSLYAGVFTLDELNVDAANSLPILLVAAGQTIVLLRGGIDLSIGGVISLGTVLASTRFGDDYGTSLCIGLAILAIGAGVGAVNGLLIAQMRLQPFLVTLATWSILAGAALLVLPTDGGSLPSWWTAIGTLTLAGVQAPFWGIVLVGCFWLWFSRTRLCAEIRGVGSNERSAFLSGVRVQKIEIVAYTISGLFAALTSLALSIQMASGSPTVGNGYILTSVAAAVIGGVSVFGGRGSIWCAMVGAAILAIIANLVFVLQVSSYWQPAMAGAILLVAVVAGSLAEALAGGDAR